MVPSIHRHDVTCDHTLTTYSAQVQYKAYFQKAQFYICAFQYTLKNIYFIFCHHAHTHVSAHIPRKWELMSTNVHNDVLRVKCSLNNPYRFKRELTPQH